MLGLRYIDVILISTFLITKGLTLDKCVPHPPCLCEFVDGRVIDLRPLGNESAMEGTNENLTYFFHPCANINLTISNLGNEIIQNCNQGTSLCMLNKTEQNNTQKIVNIGKSEDAQLMPSIVDNGLYDMIFPNKNNNKMTFITLICTEHIKDSILHVVHSKDFPKHHDLILYSHYACPLAEVRGLSTGSVLVIILLIFSGVYLLGGACILHFLRGARGKEMIPNIDFWSDLPLLVRDGVIFLQNGCKPPQQPGETYDRI